MSIETKADTSIEGSQITILRPVAKHAILTKRFVMSGEGEIDKINFGNVKNFRCEQFQVSGIFELAELLSKLESDPRACIIRGEPMPHVDLSKPVRRTKWKTGNEEPYFRSVEEGQPWLCIDFDDLKCPDHIAAETDPEAAIRHLISLLPPEFHNVTCLWQWSSSAGVKGWDNLRAHLWFWLDRGVHDDDLRRWAKTNDVKIDGSLFNAVQVHYTAAPIFEDVPDPVRRRSGLLRGLSDAVQLEVPPKAVPSPKTPTSGGLVESVGFDGLLKQIGDHEGGAGFHEPITRAIASYVATNGPEFDREALKERVRAAILSAENHHRDQSVIDRYSSDRDLDASIDGAIEKFGSAAKGRLILDVKPYFNADELSADDAKAKIDEAVTDWWDREVNWEKYQSVPDKWPLDDPWDYENDRFHDWAYDGRSLVVLGAAGIGKSRIAIEAIKQIVRADSDTVVWYLAPTVELAQELAEKYGPDARVIRGRTHKDANGETLCQKPDAVVAVAGRVPSITKALCENDGARCEFYNSCPYYQQFMPRCRVYFMSHEYAFQPPNPKVERPDFVFVDENILPNFVVMPTPVSPREFYDSAGRYELLAKFIVAALDEGRSLKAALKEVRPFWTAKRLRKAAERLEAANSPYVSPDMSLESIQRALNKKSVSRIASTAFRAITDELSLQRDECYSVALREAPVTRLVSGTKTETREKMLFVQYRRKMTFKRGTRYLILDATGDEELLTPSFLGLRGEQVDAVRNATVIQAYGFRASKTALIGNNDEKVRHRREIAELLKSFPAEKSGLLVTYKAVVAQIETPDNWKAVHFGNLRGIDKYHDDDIVVIAGRLEPQHFAVERLAMGLSSDSERTLTLLDEDRYPEVKRGYRMSDGSRFGVMVPCHPDPFVQSLLEQVREAEIIQAVDRLRLRWNKKEKLVVILTEIPVDITVDALVPYRDLVNGGGKFDKAAAELEWVLPSDPKYLSERFPEFWATSGAARRALQRAKDRQIGLNSPLSYKYIYREWGTLIPGFLNVATPYEYRRQGQSGRPSTCYSLQSAEETRQWLEKRFGELAAFGPLVQEQLAA